MVDPFAGRGDYRRGHGILGLAGFRLDRGNLRWL